jgi:hypothetical protein
MRVITTGRMMAEATAPTVPACHGHVDRRLTSSRSAMRLPSCQRHSPAAATPRATLGIDRTRTQ